MNNPVHVVAGVIRDGAGRVLVTRRGDHVHQGGLWEFPGGKLEAAEQPLAGLVRELREELDIAVNAARPLIRVRHAYPEREVLLDVWEVLRFSGAPRGVEAQPLHWVDADALRDLQMPPADRPVINAVRLPDRYVITRGDARDFRRFMELLEASLQAGARLLQLRVRELEADRLVTLSEPVTAACHRHGARVLLNGPPQLAARLGFDGVHLNARRLAGLKQRPLPGESWVAASCHDAAGIARAEGAGVDFVTLSPVNPTTSHPEGRPLGWERFRSLCENSALPVFALGGVGPGDLTLARDSGAQGVAGISAFWGAPVPGRKQRGTSI